MGGHLCRLDRTGTTGPSCSRRLRRQNRAKSRRHALWGKRPPRSKCCHGCIPATHSWIRQLHHGKPPLPCGGHADLVDQLASRQVFDTIDTAHLVAVFRRAHRRHDLIRDAPGRREGILPVAIAERHVDMAGAKVDRDVCNFQVDVQDGLP